MICAVLQVIDGVCVYIICALENCQIFGLLIMKHLIKWNQSCMMLKYIHINVANYGYFIITPLTIAISILLYTYKKFSKRNES